MRALVSGSTGFSGSFLAATLRARGFEVHAVSHRSQAPGVERIDFSSSSAWGAVLREVRPDHVFHLSGVAHSAKLSDFALHNTAAAAALLDAMVDHGPPPSSVLVVGSAAEYGLVPEAALPVHETFLASPRSAYGVTKYAQTQLALEAARKGLRVIVARPSNIVGPGMPRGSALGSFAHQIRQVELGLRSAVLSVGDLSTSRDFVDVRDVADTYVSLATHPNFSGVVNVSSGEQVVMRSILDQMIVEFGVPVRVDVDVSRLRSAEVQKFSASTRRLREALGDRPFIPLSESVRDIVAHERSQRS